MRLADGETHGSSAEGSRHFSGEPGEAGFPLRAFGATPPI
jgi:hypothetical protein